MSAKPIDLPEIMRRAWESACQEKPFRPSCQVVDGRFFFTVTGNRDNWLELCKAAGVPANARHDISDTKLVCSWESYADSIFGVDGLMAQHLPNYEPRLPQLHMARMVQRTIEMNETSTIEAGTGVGKGFAYAAIAMAMNKRVVISTSNKALQMQLYQKDIPFLQKLFPGKNVAMVQGKTNYLCKAKIETDSLGGYTIIGKLLDWYLSSESGNTEEIPFEVDQKKLNAVVVDEYCSGKRCPLYESCFYYAAKKKREAADILICNHMLLCLNQLYPSANILPGAIDLIVIDEAHQFPEYMRNALGNELTLSAIMKRIDLLEKHGVDDDDILPAVKAFTGQINDFIGAHTELQLGIDDERTFTNGAVLAALLNDAADEIWSELEVPSSEDLVKKVDADRVRLLATGIEEFSQRTMPGNVRWLDTRDQISLHNAPYDVAVFIQNMIEHQEKTVKIDYTRCTRCGRKLTANVVAVLAELPYGPDCIKHVDPMGDAEHVSLEQWLSNEKSATSIVRIAPPIVFCSATLATPDMTAFWRECGIRDAMQMIAASPFDYQHNTLLYIPTGIAPAPNSDEFINWAIGEIADLVEASRGGAFLLFTSYKNMKMAHDVLRHQFEKAGLTVFQQGNGFSKLEIAKRFRENGNAVLFATKSFWEGVSIEGDALRLVVIDKIPLPAPSPLIDARRRHLSKYAKTELGIVGSELEFFPFMNLDVPHATLDVKQGVGRLIRTQRDRGVIAILDGRMRTKDYARRRILKSLPPAPLINEMYQVKDFFAEMREEAAQKLIIDLTPVGKFGVQIGADVDDIFV